MMSQGRFNSFMKDAFIIKKPDLQSKSMDRFYTTETSVIKEVMLCYLYVLIEIYIP